MRPFLILFATLLMQGAGMCAYAGLFDVGNEAFIIDMRPHLKLYAQFLKESEPPVSWMQMHKAPEMDDIRLVGGDKVLVGLVDITTKYPVRAFSPIYGPYVLFDRATGNKLWEIERKPGVEAGYQLSVLGQAVHVLHQERDEGELSAYDLATGKRLWGVEARGKLTMTPIDADLLALAAVYKGSVEITVLNRKSGSTVWKRKEPFGGELADMRARHSLLVLVGEDLLALKLSDGSIAQRYKLGPTGGAPDMHDLTEGLLIAGADGSVSSRGDDMVERWSVNLGGLLQASTVDRDAFYAAVAVDSGHALVIAVSLRGGKVLWKTPVPGPLQSGLFADGDRLLFTARGSIHVLTTTGGAKRAEARLPKNDTRLPDHLVFFPGTVVAASENWVASYSGAALTPGWRFETRGADYFTSARLPGGMASAPVKSAAASTGPNLSAMWEAQSRRQLQQAQQYREQVYRDTDKSKSDSSYRETYRLERKTASEARIGASRMEIANLQATRSLDKAFAGLELAAIGWGQMLSIGERAQAGADAAYEDRQHFAAGVARKAHVLSIQGNLYLRPILWEGGAGLLLVDMRNGKWTEIPTNPPEGDLKDQHYMNTRLTLAIEDGRYLVTQGIGMSPQQWQLDERHMHRSVYRSIIQYDLGNWRLLPAKDYPARSLTKE